MQIAVADDEPDMREYYQKVLPRLGHRVTTTARDGHELVDKCLADWPDLVISDLRMPRMDGIEAAQQLYRHKPLPVILVSAYHDEDTIQRAEDDHVMAYLVKPIKQADLQPAIAIAMRRFEQFQQLAREAADLRQALNNRRLIEQAKGVLMKRASVGENDAFTRLQTLATSEQKKLVEVAEMILWADTAFDPARP